MSPSCSPLRGEGGGVLTKFEILKNENEKCVGVRGGGICVFHHAVTLIAA